jgi:hypothetical protein
MAGQDYSLNPQLPLSMTPYFTLLPRQVSPWLGWWSALHPAATDLGVPVPLDCAAALPGEPTFIKNGFDGFHGTGLHEDLQQRGIDTLVIIGLITRACVLNTVMSAFNNGFGIMEYILIVNVEMQISYSGDRGCLRRPREKGRFIIRVYCGFSNFFLEGWGLVYKFPVCL